MSPAPDSVLITLLSRLCFDVLDPHLEFKALMSRITDTAIELTGGERARVFLEDEHKSGRLISVITTGTGEKNIEIESGKGVVGQVFRTSLPLIVNDIEANRYFFPDIDRKTSFSTRNVLCVPLRNSKGKSLGALEVLNCKRGSFRPEDLNLLQILSIFAAMALSQRETLVAYRDTDVRLRRTRSLDQLGNASLKSRNQPLQDIYRKIPELGANPISVLIEGESGTGKDVIARLLHLKSNRQNKPFVAVNCAAIPESLIEAELFGVSRRTAPGTVAQRGKVELAAGGTLFLDEVGELPLPIQSKLLRVLQEKAVTRIGSEEGPVGVDFRLITATSQNLLEQVRAGRFRQDLYFRINVVQLTIPPLRARVEDIPELCESIIKSFESEHGWKAKRLSPRAMKAMRRYSWPGNIRELRNKLESAYISSGSAATLDEKDFSLPQQATTNTRHSGSGKIPDDTVMDSLDVRKAKAEIERILVNRALEKTGGNRTHAAKLLGLTRQGLIKAISRM